VCAKPFLVLEQGARRHGNLPVLIPREGRGKRASISQDVAPALDDCDRAVARMICAGVRATDGIAATNVESQSP